MFDWQRFLDQHAIDYIVEGPNVARGNVNIHCPFCGTDDPSHHLGISLQGQGWGCWRRPDHRGKSPIRLVRALLNCSLEQAQRIVGGTAHIPADFLSQVQVLTESAEREDEEVGDLEMPQEFRPFQKPMPISGRPHLNYLRGRNFTDYQIYGLTKRYGVRFCTRGPYQGRIIFPIWFEKRLVCWTGRSISSSAVIRYKTLSDDPEKAAEEGLPPAVGPLNRYLLWWDDLRRTDADTIYVVEGPFDALKVRVLGHQEGVTATCLFTAHETVEQAELLHDLLPRFKHRFVMLDREMFAGSVRISRILAGLGVQPRVLPARVKDPGDLLSTEQLMQVGRAVI